MKNWLHIFMFVGLGLNIALGAELAKVSYCVQLICGDNDEKPLQPPVKPIGEKLAAKLRSVFTWKNYREITRQPIELAPGRKIRVKLGEEREVEIDLAQPGKRTVTAYAKGQPISRSTRVMGEGWTITGGDRDNQTAWFIVVSRAEPPK